MSRRTPHPVGGLGGSGTTGNSGAPYGGWHGGGWYGHFLRHVARHRFRRRSEKCPCCEAQQEEWARPPRAILLWLRHPDVFAVESSVVVAVNARETSGPPGGVRGEHSPPAPSPGGGVAGYASLTRRLAGVCYTSGDGGLGPRVRLPARATVFRGVTRRSTGCRAGFSVNLGRESHVDQSVNGTVSDHVVNGYPPVNPPPPAMSRPTRASTRPECLP